MKSLHLTYLPPLSLLEQADKEMAALPQDRLFNDSAYQKFTEKWCAAMMGLGYEKHVAPCRVAVNDTDQRGDADFFLETSGALHPFQLAEVQVPGRERGAEFRAFARGELPVIPYEPERGRREGPGWIADAIQQKIKKKYAGSKELNLLLYVNFSARDLQHADVVEAARPYLAAFASVWAVSSLWLGVLEGGKVLGGINGWGIIFTVEEADAHFDKNRARS